jgi:hypothetical protein
VSEALALFIGTVSIYKTYSINTLPANKSIMSLSKFGIKNLLNAIYRDCNTGYGLFQILLAIASFIVTVQTKMRSKLNDTEVKLRKRFVKLWLVA